MNVLSYLKKHTFFIFWLIFCCERRAKIKTQWVFLLGGLNVLRKCNHIQLHVETAILRWLWQKTHGHSCRELGSYEKQFVSHVTLTLTLDQEEIWLDCD